MITNQARIVTGATVYDSTGEKVGTVQENNMQDGYLVVAKGWLFPKDFYVPMSAVERADAEGVFLDIGSDELQSAHYNDRPMPRDQAGDATMSRGASATGDIRVPVREEELVVGKQRAEEGRVHVHKEVVTEQQTVQVPLRQERVSVERVPLSDNTSVDDQAFVERDIDVPVMGEEAVVGKRVAGVEEVVIRKDVVTEQEQVTDSVRKERVTVDGVSGGGQTIVDRSGRTDPSR